VIEHARWNDVYERSPSELSWYQAEPVVSLELIDALGVERDESVVDIGGGASSLAGRLLERGFTDVTVVDVAQSALAKARGLLGDAAGEVTWLVQDVRRWQPDRRYSLWHDRALFHFLVEDADRRRYLDAVERALGAGGRVVIATFAPDGPERCSGMPVVRYDGAGLAAAFGPGFELVHERREEHHTPRGAIQPFTWVALRRRR
jgi:trans-aconitate methyltransferase